MKVIFKNEEAREQYCEKDSDTWRRYPEKVKDSLEQLDNFIKSAESLQDLRIYPPLHLEIMKGKIQKRKKPTGEWSVRVTGTQYRVIFIPCDDNERELIGGDILAQARTIKIIKVTEVSKHYA